MSDILGGKNPLQELLTSPTEALQMAMKIKDIEGMDEIVQSL